MKLFDTHCHFECDDEYEISAQLERARAVGVDRILAVGGSPALNASADAAARLGCLKAKGWDRDQAGAEHARNPVDDGSIAAVGEIGLDYHYSPETRAAQLELFSRQLEYARSRELPVIVHAREADDDTLGALREIPCRGVIHCFTGTPAFARRLLDLGFFISISGIVTFASAGNVRESAMIVPDDRLLIETDSPYLAPVPRRGGRNEPAFLLHVCEFLSELRGVPAERLAKLTFDNAISLLTVLTEN